MNKQRMFAANIVLIAAAILIGAFLYPAFPEEIASHWNAAGEMDGTMPKFWGLFLIPFIMVAIFVLSIVLPHIDPMRENVQAFRRSYQSFFLWINVFSFYLFLLMIAWNLGWRFDFNFALLPALAALWFIIGSLLERSKRNWFVGIRTPWTMESEEVWDKTHALGGKLFKISAAVTLLGIFFPEYFVYIAVVPVAATVLVTVVYSYVLFKQERTGF